MDHTVWYTVGNRSETWPIPPTHSMPLITTINSQKKCSTFDQSNGMFFLYVYFNGLNRGQENSSKWPTILLYWRSPRPNVIKQAFLSLCSCVFSEWYTRSWNEFSDGSPPPILWLSTKKMQRLFSVLYWAASSLSGQKQSSRRPNWPTHPI